MRSSAWGAGAAASLLLGCGVPEVGAIVVPSGFATTDLIASGLSNPTSMVRRPDGSLLIAQQNGAIRVFSGGTLLSTPLVTIPNVRNSGEQGLIGITIDPDYSNNRYVYVHYTVNAPTSAQIHNRVSRLTVAADGVSADAASEAVLVELDNIGPSVHNGGAIHFGPDGKLYVAVGEAGTGSNAQSLANRRGKILRYNPDGSIPADNPTTFRGLTGSPSGVNQAIWAVGLRNPFTFAFQPGTGRMHINDVGASSWEEINVGGAGLNFGWPTTEGDFNADTYPNFTRPLHAYPRTVGYVTAGGAFYNPASAMFPSSFVGSYFHADSGRGWVRVLDVATGVSSEFATAVTAPVDLEVTDDGRLLILRRSGTAPLIEVRYVQGACCAGTVCTVTTAMVCTTGFQGLGSACGPVDNPTTCCIANFNRISGVTIDDLFLYFNAWFLGDPSADIDGQPGVAIDDLFGYVNGWFIGC